MKLFRAASALAAVMLCSSVARAEQGKLRMHVINVGQAESILIEMPNHALLIDAAGEDTERDGGNAPSQDFYWGRLRDYLDGFFAANPHLNKTLYALVLSHPHKDHTKYLSFILNRYTVRHFIEGGHSGTSDYSGIGDVVRARQIVSQKGIGHIRVKWNTVDSQALRTWARDIEQRSGARVRFLSGRRGCNNANNDSLVMRVEFGQKSLLLTGDSQDSDQPFGQPWNEGCGGQLEYLLRRYSADPSVLDADVYKVGHHGAKNGTYRAFLRQVTPDYAVISAGHFSDQSPGHYHGWNHGHPNETTIRRLEEFATGRDGQPATVFTMRGQYDVIENRLMAKNIYCTCWNTKAVVVTLSGDNAPIDVDEIPQ